MSDCTREGAINVISLTFHFSANDRITQKQAQLF